MNSFILLNPEHTGKYYALFYFLGFLAGFLLLIKEGYKRKFPLISWMLVIGTAFLFFIVGCRFIAFSLDEWRHVFRLEPVPYQTRLSVLGGILFSIPGILLARKCLSFKYEMLDAFAFVLPVALMIQRFGCLMAGCCYGTPGNMPWAVQYGRNSNVFAQHIHDGILTAQAGASLPVHPVQLYEVLGCFVVTILLTRLRKNLRSPGNLFLSSIGLYAAMRFVLEFVRARGGHAVGGDFMFHLNYVQWTLMLVLLVIIFIVQRKEKSFVSSKPVSKNMENGFARSVIFLCAFMSFYFLVSRWLSSLEIVSFNIVLLPMLGILAWKWFTSVTVPGFRWASILVPAGSLVLMSQTLPEYARNDSTRFSYSSFSLGMMGGNTNLSSTSILENDGYNACAPTSAPYTTTTTCSSDNTFSAGAIGFSRTIQKKDQQVISFGLNGFLGTHSEAYDKRIVSTRVGGNADFPQNQTFSTYGIKPYFQVDGKKVGFGVGFTIGEMSTIDRMLNTDLSTPAERTSVKRLSFAPAMSIRFGEISKFFVEYRLANQFVTTFPTSYHQLSFGGGFGKTSGTVLRVGTASRVSLFIEPSFPLGANFRLEPYLGFGGGILNGYNTNQGFNAAVSLHYKFNKKPVL